MPAIYRIPNTHKTGLTELADMPAEAFEALQTGIKGTPPQLDPSKFRELVTSSLKEANITDAAKLVDH